jgi:3',5'-cyclic-AMP phosphodiesterase
MRTNPRFRLFFALGCLFAFLLLLIPSPTHSEENPFAGETPLLSFSVMSDVHISNAWSPNGQMGVFKFGQALRDVRSLHPDFLVINGDLANMGKPDEYKVLQDLLDEYSDVPMYPTMGNHDYYYQWENPEWNDERAQTTFRQLFNLDQLHYDLFIKGVHFIWLSPEQYMPRVKEIGEAAWLSPETLHWFEQTLLGSQAPTFVFLHQPLDGTVSRGNFSLGTAQYKELEEIVARHPQVVWFSGHTHLSPDMPTELVKKGNALYVGHGSVYQPWEISNTYLPGAKKRGDLYMHSNILKSQSRYVDVYKDKIVVRTRNHHTHTWNKPYVEPLRTPFAEKD